MNRPKLPVLIARNRFEEEKGFVAHMNRDGAEIDLLIDSGAYAYWRRGETMTVDNYMAWLDRFPHRGDDYIQLDVIGDVDQTRRNLDAMLKRGFKPWPVFQRGSPEAWLPELAKLGRVVAIGCGIGTPGFMQYAAFWAKRAHELGIPVHVLGISHLGIISKYRPYSCDSSGKFADAGRWGRLDMLDKVYRHGQPIAPKHKALIRSLGFDPGVLRDPTAW